MAAVPAGGEGRGPLLPALAAVTGLLDWSGRLIAAACLLALFLPLLVNVVMRYTGLGGIAWAYEIHALLLPWLIAGGIVVAAARSRNIAITLLPDALSPGGRRILAAVLNACVVAISLAVLWSSQPILKASTFQNLSTLGIKQIWGYASIVYTFGGLAIIALVDVLRALMGADVLDTSPEHSSLS